MQKGTQNSNDLIRWPLKKCFSIIRNFFTACGPTLNSKVVPIVANLKKWGPNWYCTKRTGWATFFPISLSGLRIQKSTWLFVAFLILKQTNSMPQILSSGLQRKSCVGASRFLICSNVSVLLIQSNQINIKHNYYTSALTSRQQIHISYHNLKVPLIILENQVYSKLKQNSKLFRFHCITQMRREILSKARKDSMRMLKEPSLRVLQQAETEVAPVKTLKKLNLHMRSRTRQFQQQSSKNYVNHLQTPAPFLPKIAQSSDRACFETEKTGLDNLQEHLHRMLLKNLRKCKENKQIKSIEDEIDKKRTNLKEKEEYNQKQCSKNRLQQLQTKLNQLYCDMATEQNKLKIEYSLEQKLERRYNNFYDKMARRFQKNNTVDAGQNTQQIQVIKQVTKQPSKQLKKSKNLSKFRAAAYAVYFSLFFPRYTKKFHAIRKKYFIKTIILQRGIQRSIQECYRLFELMKLKSFWKQLENKNKELPQEPVSAILSDAGSKDEPISYNFKLENINSLLQFVLSSIRSTVKAGKIDDFIKTVGFALTNRSYITDRFFLESELFEVNVNQQMMMNLSPSQERILLVNFLLIKLVAFSFMMNNSFISECESNYLFNKEKSNKFENLTFSISKQLLLCGIYLIKLCNQLNQQSKTAQNCAQGNIECTKIDELLPLPMPSLQLKSKLVFTTSGKRIMNKRISIQDDIEAFNTERHGIYIKNIKHLSELLQNLPANTQKQSSFITLISEIREEIYTRLILFKKQSYQQLKNLAFEQLNRKNAKQSRESLQKFPERNQQQKAQIDSYCKYFKSKRPPKEQMNPKIVKEGQQIQQVGALVLKSSSSCQQPSDSIISIA